MIIRNDKRRKLGKSDNETNSDYCVSCVLLHESVATIFTSIEVMIIRVQTLCNFCATSMWKRIILQMKLDTAILILCGPKGMNVDKIKFLFTLHCLKRDSRRVDICTG